ncbi:MAG: hypothetical protein LBU27_04130 [Candidatus Peribacteria bacterium]|nr:hypothetical protein [Candidatus Peribacteria bacterium]
METANAPDYFIKNITIDGIVYPDKINLVKQVPNADKVWIIGAERQNGFFILTHLEVAEKNVLEKVLAKGELIKLK